MPRASAGIDTRVGLRQTSDAGSPSFGFGLSAPVLQLPLYSSSHQLCSLLQRVGYKPAEELRVKVGGLLRHHFAAKRDIAHLLHAHRVHDERHVRSLLHLADGFTCVAHVPQVFLVADVLFRQSERAFQHQLVQFHHVESALPLRYVRRPGPLGTWPGTQQKTAV